jgi:hypothetical protein
VDSWTGEWVGWWIQTRLRDQEVLTGIALLEQVQARKDKVSSSLSHYVHKDASGAHCYVHQNTPPASRRAGRLPSQLRNLGQWNMAGTCLAAAAGSNKLSSSGPDSSVMRRGAERTRLEAGQATPPTLLVPDAALSRQQALSLLRNRRTAKRYHTREHARDATGRRVLVGRQRFGRSSFGSVGTSNLARIGFGSSSRSRRLDASSGQPRAPQNVLPAGHCRSPAKPTGGDGPPSSSREPQRRSRPRLPSHVHVHARRGTVPPFSTSTHQTHRTTHGHSPRNMTRHPSWRTLSTMVRRKLSGLPSALCMRVFQTSKGKVTWCQRLPQDVMSHYSPPRRSRRRRRPQP